MGHPETHEVRHPLAGRAGHRDPVAAPGQVLAEGHYVALHPADAEGLGKQIQDAQPPPVPRHERPLTLLLPAFSYPPL